MKPQLTFAFLLFCFTLTAQVRFKVKLLADNLTYQVLASPDATISAPFNIVTSAQVTLRVPTGGFTIGNLKDLNGKWKWGGTSIAPVENPGYDYIFISWDTGPTSLTLTEGAELPLFTFQHTGNCTGAMQLINNDSDPYIFNNSNVSPVNSLVALGQDLYTGNYSAIPADCTESGCDIEVFDVILTSPSACGVADGSIEFVATPDQFGFIEFTINYGTPGVIWQANNAVFDNLAAGDIFYLAARDFLGCVVDLGQVELDGPLAAIITGVDVENPDCGNDNGSITIHAVPQNGGSLQYSMSQSGPFQVSNTFTGLAEGDYSFWVRDVVNNCQNFVGTFSLDGCQEPDCLATFNLESLGNGQYQVTLLSDTTWNAPLDNFTASLQTTIRVPAGVELSDPVSALPNVDFIKGSTYQSPPENPDFDYITFSLQTGTNEIPYIQGQTITLFTFTNTGACTGDSIRFIALDDPFYPPNSQSAGVEHQMSVMGNGGDVSICLGTSAAVCSELPPPVPTCIFNYEIEKLATGEFQVALLPDTTLVFPNNVTSSLQATIKVPTGGFVVQNLTNLLPTVNPFGTPSWQSSVVVAPAEDPAHDYITIALSSGVPIPMTQGDTVLLFHFRNGGTCQGGNVFIMDNDTDPFLSNPNFDVRNYLSVNTVDYMPCITNPVIDDCFTDPCAVLSVGFTADDVCDGEAVIFTNTTTSIDSIISWNWSFGDGSSSDIESPSHSYSTSGNFEVSLTVTTESGCEATFSEFVTVFSNPGSPAVTSYSTCNGVGVVLQGPAGATTAVWNPATGLDNPALVNPTATPATTTVYTVTYDNGTGCETSAQITVNVANKPIFLGVTATDQSDCNVQDGSILVSALGVGSLEFSLDNINWQSDSLFSNLPPGNYNIFVRNAGGSCPSAYNGNPVTVGAPLQAAITSVSSTDPSSCGSADGSIVIVATGGNGPLLYSIDGGANFVDNGGTFNGLAAGSYQVAIANNDGSCEIAGQAVVLNDPPNPTISPVADFSLCVGSSSTINIQLSETIVSYSINGTGSYFNETIAGNTLTFDLVALQGSNNTFNVSLAGANGCLATENFTVTGLTVPNASFATSSTLCTNGEITFNFNGTAGVNASYNWSFGNGTVTFSSQDNKTKKVSYATAGTKTICLEVLDNGCSDNFCLDIAVSAFDPQASTSVANASCGLNNGTINLNLTGGGNYSFNWNNNASTQNISGLSAGLYVVTITSDAGCSTTASANVASVAGVGISNVTPSPAVDCGNSDGSIAVQVAGGLSSYTYNLYKAGQQTLMDQFTGSMTSVTFDGLESGVWQVVVEDANGCTDSEMVSVTSSNSSLAVSNNTQLAGCGLSDGAATLNISGGLAPFTYTFYKNNVLQGQDIPIVGTSVVLNNLAPDSYAAIIEDANGCILPVLFSIQSQPANFAVTATETDPGCGANNGSIELSDLPQGATLNWSVGGGANPLTGLQSGVYNVTITNGNGCSQTNTYVLSPANSAQVSISNLLNSTCGEPNGSVTFTVSGFNSFTYEILGTGIQGNANGNTPVEVSGFGTGAYVIQVDDNGLSNCVVYEVFTVSGGVAMQTNSTVTTATACGVADASVCFKITGGTAPYQVTTDKGFVEAGISASEFCIKGLYEGIVNVTIEDNSGCTEDNLYDVPNNFEEPELTVDSLEVNSFTCPGGLGSIYALTGHVYEIYDINTNTKVAETPWTAVPAGTYEVKYSTGDCEVAVLVTVDGPADWNLAIAQQNNVSCLGNDGSLEVSVAGGTFPYAFEWSNGDTAEVLAGVGEGYYSVTVTDAAGCSSVLEDLLVNSDCEDCESVFLVDTFYAELTPGLTEICLPTELPSLSGYILGLNGGLYTEAVDVCIKSSVFYGYSQLNSLDAPFVLEEWNVNGEKVTGQSFYTVEELIAIMNGFDQLGNWANVDLASGITGGTSIEDYGAMTIRHEQTGTTFILMPDGINVERPSIFVDDEPMAHTFIVVDPATNCIDTLYINLLPAETNSDHVEITINVGEDTVICIPADELAGVPVLLFNNCISGIGNAEVTSLGANQQDCEGYTVEIEGLSEGTEEACMVLCDNLGNCDTTFLHINVVDASTELIIHNGFSPNQDGFNDFFHIKNIELDKYKDNSLTVFNRWGNRVYSQKGYTNSNPWQAIYKNTYLPDGTYFYVLEVNEVQADGRKKKREYKGFVEVRK